MQSPDHGGRFEGRVASLETSVANLHVEIGDIRKALADGFGEMRNMSNASSKTNWGVVISGVMLVGALYAAAVAPIKGDVGRLEALSERQADAVIEQNKVLNSIMVIIGERGAVLATLRKDIDKIVENGAPVTDKRLSVIEYELAQLRKK